MRIQKTNKRDIKFSIIVDKRKYPAGRITRIFIKAFSFDFDKSDQIVIYVKQ